MALPIHIIKLAAVQGIVSRRTRIVWAGFAVAATLTSGLLVLGDANGPRPLAMAPVIVGARDTSIMPREAKLDRQRWTSIVIHHSNTPAGDMSSVARLQGASDASGIGYHFLIGNGQGIADGSIEVAARWNRQEPGAHVASLVKNFAGHSDIKLVSSRSAPSGTSAAQSCSCSTSDRCTMTGCVSGRFFTLYKRATASALPASAPRP